MSSFKRKAAVTTASVTGSVTNSDSSNSVSSSTQRATGVKPWMTGPGLVSCGHKELDEICGGGSLLGSYWVVECNEATSGSQFGEALLSYAVAESLSVAHHTLLLAADEADLKLHIEALPYNLFLSEGDESSESCERDNQPSGTAAELKIAWQYAKYLQQSERLDGCTFNQSTAQLHPQVSARPVPSSSSTVYCNSFDLSRR